MHLTRRVFGAIVHAPSRLGEPSTGADFADEGGAEGKVFEEPVGKAAVLRSGILPRPLEAVCSDPGAGERGLPIEASSAEEPKAGSTKRREAAEAQPEAGSVAQTYFDAANTFSAVSAPAPAPGAPTMRVAGAQSAGPAPKIG